MKYIWIWIAGIAFTIWALTSIINTIYVIIYWIKQNIKKETVTITKGTNNIVPKTKTKIKWTNEFAFERACARKMNVSTDWFWGIVVLSLGALFFASLIYFLATAA